MSNRFTGRLRHIAIMVWLNSIAASYCFPASIRKRMYNFAGLQVQTDKFGAGCFIGGTQMSVGSGTFVNVQCFFDTAAAIEIGSNCSIGMQTTLITSSHLIGGSELRASEPSLKPIVIHDGCWLGARVIVMPGVTVGKGCIIGTGSLVTKNCMANGLYLGSPARRVRDLD